jgi:hypothetical protein
MRVFVPILFCLWLAGCSDAEWDKVSQQDIPSPDYVATVFEMCSYNTTGDWPQVSLRRPSQRWGRVGNVLSGGPGDRITARWVSARDLAVEYHVNSPWVSYPPDTTNIYGVTITFKKL